MIDDHAQYFAVIFHGLEINNTNDLWHTIKKNYIFIL